MKRTVLIPLFILIAMSVPAVYGQQDKEAGRIRTREQLAQLLAKTGPGINIAFRRHEKEPFMYVGSLTRGLVHAESFEVNISVTSNETISFRIYPHYRNGYINVDKVKSSSGLMRFLLRLSDTAFLFWGVDAAGDVFTGYTFTLESGFPEESLKTVLRSIMNSDKFVGEMRPFIDGTNAR